MILQRPSEHLRDQRSLEDVRKFFEIKGLSGILEGSLPTTIIRGSSEELPVQRSSKDLRKIFEMEAHSRIFARSLRSKIIQGSSEDIEGHSRIFGKSLRSKIVQGPSEYLRYQILFRDLFVTVYRKTQDVTSQEQFCCPLDIEVYY